MWEEYLRPVRAGRAAEGSVGMRLERGLGKGLNVRAPEKVLAGLKLDRSVAVSRHFVGGEVEAGRRLRRFVDEKLLGYAQGRNEPAAGQSSALSGYLHFGQISPVEMALAAMGAVKKRPECGADVDAFLEELIVRRELAVNYVHHCPRYDSFEGLPNWARATLARGMRRTSGITCTAAKRWRRGGRMIGTGTRRSGRWW